MRVVNNNSAVEPAEAEYRHDYLLIALAMCRAGATKTFDLRRGELYRQDQLDTSGSDRSRHYVTAAELAALVWVYSHYTKLKLNKFDVESIVSALPAATQIFKRGR